MIIFSMYTHLLSIVWSMASVDRSLLSTTLIGGSKGGDRDARPPPPRVQILSFSCSFRQKIEK